MDKAEPTIFAHDDAVHIARWREGKRCFVLIPFAVIDAWMQPNAMTDRQRENSVRNNLPMFLAAAEAKIARGAEAGAVTLYRGDF